MRSNAGVRQLEYVVASKLEEDAWTHWEATMYSEAFEHVEANGTSEDMTALVDHISGDVRDGYRPDPTEVRNHADTLLTADGRPLTDGGEE